MHLFCFLGLEEKILTQSFIIKHISLFTYSLPSQLIMSFLCQSWECYSYPILMFSFHFFEHLITHDRGFGIEKSIQNF